MSAVLLSLWVVGTFFMAKSMAGMNLLIPVPSLILAGASSLLLLVSYARPNMKHGRALTRIGFALFLIAILILVGMTGHTQSPFLGAWLLVSLFTAVFGLRVFIPAAILTNAYLGYLLFSGNIIQEEIVMFSLAFEIPLVISVLVWHRGPKESESETNKDSTFKALAQELSQVANKSEIVINAIADGVVAIDGQGIVQLINPAAQRIIGWGKQDALKLDYRSVLPLFNQKDEDLNEQTDPIQLCLHTNETISTEDLILTTTSGKKIMVSLLVSPVGQIGSGAIVVFRDITAQRAEERRQAEFISTASHEMRTPVAAIEGYLGLALNPQTATIDEKAKLYLTKAHESAQHLGRLFQDLLDISKAEDNRLKNDPTITDVVSFAREVTQGFMHMAAEKKLILMYQPDTRNPANQHITPAYFANVDPDHLREVLSNTIENAIKYTKTGDVKIDVGGDELHVVLTISDTGIGIPSEDIPHLFQKFYRVDSSDTREIGGTGLGLYLCRRLTEAMGGRLWVTSEYGRGSQFHIELPRMNNNDAMHGIEAAAEEPNTPPITPTAATPLPPVAPTPPPTPMSPPAVATPAPVTVPVIATPVARPMPTPAPRPAQTTNTIAISDNSTYNGS